MQKLNTLILTLGLITGTVLSSVAQADSAVPGLNQGWVAMRVTAYYSGYSKEQGYISYRSDIGHVYLNLSSEPAKNSDSTQNGSCSRAIVKAYDLYAAGSTSYFVAIHIGDTGSIKNFTNYLGNQEPALIANADWCTLYKSDGTLYTY